jgi:hypothetical protein
LLFGCSFQNLKKVIDIIGISKEKGCAPFPQRKVLRGENGKWNIGLVGLKAVPILELKGKSADKTSIKGLNGNPKFVVLL